MRFLVQANIQITAVRTTSRDPNPAVVARARGDPHVNGLLLVSDPDGQFAQSSAVHIFERKRQFRLRFRRRRPRSRPRASSCSRGAASAESSHSACSSHSTEKHFKEIAEGAAPLLAAAAEEIFHIDRTLEAAAAPVGWRSKFSAVLPVRTELVVLPPLIVVAENFVRFLNFLKLFFSLFVVRIQVRMVFAGKLAVCLFDFLFLRGARNTKDFIIIAKLHCHGSKSRTGIAPTPRNEPWSQDSPGTGVNSLLQTDFESFAGGNHVWVEFAGVVQYFFDVRIFVIWIVMEKSNPLYFRFNSDLDGLLPTAMTPPDVFRQFLRRVLSIDDEEIGVFRETHHVPVAPVDAVLHVRALRDHLAVLHDAVADAALRVI